MPKNIGVVLSLKDRASSSIKQLANKVGMTNEQFKQASKSVKDFSKELNKTVNNVKKFAQATAVGFGAVVAGGVALAKKTAEAGDRIDKMSQKIGMSRKAFQEWDFIMSQNGGSVDSLQMGYKTLATQMVNASKGSKDTTAIFKRLGVAIKDNNGNLRTQDEVFNESVRALQRIKNPTEKAIMAQKLFGKSAMDLKPLLNQSADSVDELRDKANKLGFVLSDDVVNASVAFTDTQDVLNRSIEALGATIGAEFIPIMQTASNFIIDNMPTIKAVVQSALNPIISIVKFLAEHIKALTIVSGIAITVIGGFKVLATIGKLIQAYNAMVTASSVVTRGWAVVTALMSQQFTQLAIVQDIMAVKTALLTAKQWLFNTSLYGCPVIWVVGAIIGLIAVIVLLAKNWDTVTATVQKWGATLVQWCSSAWEKVKEVFGAIGNFIKEHFIDVLLFALGPIGMIISAVKNIGGAISNLKNKGGSADGGEKPSKHATGTSYFGGGATQINEGGRGEIVNLPSGSQIIPHDIAKRDTGKKIDIKIDFNIAGNVIGKSELFDEFAQMLAVQIQNKLQTV